MLFESVNRFNFWQLARTIWVDAYSLSYFSEGTDPAMYVFVLKNTFANHIEKEALTLQVSNC